MSDASSIRKGIFLAGILVGMLTGVIPWTAAAQGAYRPYAYDIDAPVFPKAFSDAEKAAQRSAGTRMIAEMRTALGRDGDVFTIPPGVYRLAKGQMFRAGAKSYRIVARDVEIIQEGNENLWAPGSGGDVSLEGPLVVDMDPVRFSQARILAVSGTTATVQVMEGYPLLPARSIYRAYGPDGMWLGGSMWYEYSAFALTDASKRIGTVTIRSAEARYWKAGNLISTEGAATTFNYPGVRNITFQDVSVYTDAMFGWGRGSGAMRYIRCKATRRPGTNRLVGGAGPQSHAVDSAATVLYDGCDFGYSGDDVLNFGGGSLFMAYKQQSPRVVTFYGGSFSVGSTLRVYAHPTYATQATAKVAAIQNVADPAMQADADRTIANVFKYRAGSRGALRNVTFDRDVIVAGSGLAENTGSRGAEFTMRNCYFHDAMVRVMVQGFRKGLFENNVFERIVYQGLDATMDAWWWEGASWQNVTVRNNIFRHSPYGAAGVAAIRVGPSVQGANANDVFSDILIEGNIISNTVNDGILVNNSNRVVIRDNVIQSPGRTGIRLNAVEEGLVVKNTVLSGMGANIVVENNSDGVRVDSNRFCNTGLDPNGVVRVIGSRAVFVGSNSIQSSCDVASSTGPGADSQIGRTFCGLRGRNLVVATDKPGHVQVRIFTPHGIQVDQFAAQGSGRMTRRLALKNGLYFVRLSGVGWSHSAQIALLGGLSH